MEKEANQLGKVGIFWFFHGRLLSSSVTRAEGEEYGDHINGPDDHVTFWPTLQRRLRDELPTIADYEYDQVPRGRVLYRPAEDTFFIYGSEQFVRDATQKQSVVEHFELEGRHVVFKSDEHYGPVMGMLEDD